MKYKAEDVILTIDGKTVKQDIVTIREVKLYIGEQQIILIFDAKSSTKEISNYISLNVKPTIKVSVEEK